MLKLEQVNMSYGDVQVLWDVSFEVPKGEIVVLVGAMLVGATDGFPVIVVDGYTAIPPGGRAGPARKRALRRAFCVALARSLAQRGSPVSPAAVRRRSLPPWESPRWWPE